MYTDPISDMLTRIRNSTRAKQATIALPYSKFKHSLATLLRAEGFISGVEVLEGKIKMLQLSMKYASSGEPVISGLKRVSSPGQRIYLSADKLPRTKNGYGITVVSTSKGLLSDRQARKQKVGGEIVCQVW